MDEEEIKRVLELEDNPEYIAYLKWLLYGDGYYSSAEQNSTYY